jgi:chorismate dehydratase
MYPIYHHLEQAADPGLVFTDGLPAALNAALLDGALDVSAMSSIEYARNADRLELLPIASISAAGAVDSIQVFSHVPFEQIRSVAVTPHSATSVALLRILVGPDVTFAQLAGSPADAFDAVDGVLLIADEALHGLRDGLAPVTTDLGERWRSLTGLPMVFAVWAARRDVPSHTQLAHLTSLLRDAQTRFADDPDTVVAAAAERFPFPPDYIRGYFARLGYAFGADEYAGLRRFLDLAHDAGELPTVPALDRPEVVGVGLSGGPGEQSGADDRHLHTTGRGAL